MRASEATPVNPPSWSVTSWYVDPVNGSDSNTCTAASGSSGVGACKTIGQIFQARFGTNQPVLSHPTTITILASTSSADTWVGYRPSFGNGGSLTILAPLGGLAETPVATLTVAAFSAVNPALGVNGRPKITVTGQSWTPYLGTNYLVQGTPVSGSSYQFHLDTDLGSGVAAIDQPLQVPLVGFGQYGVPAAGDTLRIYAQPSLFLDDYQTSGNGQIVFEQLDITSSVDNGATAINQIAEFQWCSFSNTFFYTAGEDTTFFSVAEVIGGHFNPSSAYSASALLLASGIDGPNVPVLLSGTVLDGDTWVGSQFHYPFTGQIALARVGLAQFNDIDVGGRIIWVLEETSYSFHGISPAVYGAGLNVAGGAIMRNSSEGGTYASILAGLASLQLDGVAQAVPWTGSGFGSAAALTPGLADTASQWSTAGTGSVILLAGK
jgi:hypothetical protein